MGQAASVNDVRVVRDAKVILSVDALTISAGERWVIIGPNGSGKTTLVSLLSGRILPSQGRVHLLGSEVGRVDLRELRTRIGFVSGALARQFRPELTASEIVRCGVDQALEPWWRTYSDDEIRRGDDLLDAVGFQGRTDRPFAVLSDGERQLVLLARSLMTSPALLLFDEPAAGLDMGARERLVARLSAIVEARPETAFVLVTHHLEEIPRTTSHAAVLSRGSLIAAGPIRSTLTSAVVSEAFGLEVTVSEHDGRWSGFATL